MVLVVVRAVTNRVILSLIRAAYHTPSPGPSVETKAAQPPLARGRFGRQARQSASDVAEPAELRISRSIVTLLSVIVSERVELAGDDTRKECRVRWRRRGGPSDGPSFGPSGCPPHPIELPGASASGRRRTLLRVAGTGVVVTVMVPCTTRASTRALLETVTWS